MNPVRSFARHNRLLAKRYDDWMTALHYTRHTRTYYLLILGKFNQFIGKRSITGVTHLEIRQFLTHISNHGATLGTTYRYLGVLRVFFDFLNLGGVVSYVAPRLVRMKGVRRTDLPFLTEPQVRRLIAATKTKRERAILEFSYSTGCRVSEMTHLRVENIDFEGRTVRVHGKFNKTRIAFLTPSASVALRAYINNRKSGYVFQEDRKGQVAGIIACEGYWIARWVDYGRRFSCGTYKNKRVNLGRIDSVSFQAAKEKLTELLVGVNLTRPQPNRPLTSASIVHILAAIGVRAKLKNVGIHMIRRSFATHLYDHGVNIEIIQKLLGHVYLGTTLAYTRLSRVHMARAIDQNHPLAGSHEV
jgi:site-specific recombinase XerD